MSMSYILIGIVVIIVLAIIFFYNRFVTLSNRVKEAWSDIDVQLKRRYDLIPNLVETVKGYAAHEAGTLQKVTEMRTRAMNATAPAEKADAENMLSGALKTLFAVSENYPNLKANENIKQLMEELTSTENKVGFARQFYNDIATKFNISQQTFPGNIIANMFRFQRSELFEIQRAEEREAPTVNISLRK